MPRSRSLLGASAVLLALGCQLPSPPTGPLPSNALSPSPGMPSAQQSAPAAVSTPSAAPSPSPPPTPSPSPSKPTTKVTGRVFNDDQVSVAAATLTATDGSGNRVASVVADGSGVYTFPALAYGEEVIISASATNYTSRQRPIVPVGDTMTLDWNEDWALTNRPEVIAVSPEDGATGVTPKTPIELVFSVGVNQNSVTGAFAIQLDSQVPFGLPIGFTLPAATWVPRASSIVLDSSQFIATWSSSNKVKLEPRSPLPTVVNGITPSYRITLNLEGRSIQSLGGRQARESAVDDSRNTGPFNIRRIRAFSRFTMSTVSSSSLKLVSGVVSGNSIRLKFSEPLYADLATGRIAGGVDGTAASAPGAINAVTAAMAAANYTVAINGAAAVDFNTLAGAKAYFDDSDTEHKSVILGTDNPIAAAGQEVIVRLKNAVRDPMGRSIVINDIDNKLSLHSF